MWWLNNFLWLFIDSKWTDTSAISHWDTKFEKLIYEISKSRDDLRDERDQLKIQCSNLTKEMESLQSQYNTLAASRDKLQEEIDVLTHNRTGKKCTRRKKQEIKTWIESSLIWIYCSIKEIIIKRMWDKTETWVDHKRHGILLKHSTNKVRMIRLLILSDFKLVFK